MLGVPRAPYVYKLVFELEPERSALLRRARRSAGEALGELALALVLELGVPSV